MDDKQLFSVATVFESGEKDAVLAAVTAFHQWLPERQGDLVLRGKAAPAPTPRLAKGDMGIDVSQWQPEIDWHLAGTKIKFVFIKASEGTAQDRLFSTHWKGAGDVGLPRGAYHYYRVQVDPILQAELLYSLGGGGELPLVVDVEAQAVTATFDVMGPHLKRLCDRLETLAGRPPMIYTNMGYWNGFFPRGTAGWASSLPLWVAQYPFRDKAPAPDEIATMTPRLPDGWTHARFWQYSDSGRVPGIRGNVDLDIYRGEVAT